MGWGKIVGVVVVLIIVIFASIIFAFNYALPQFPGSLKSQQVTPGPFAISSNTVPILNSSEAGDWAGVTLRKVSLVVNQQFDNDISIWYSHFVDDSSLRILSKLGIEIVDKPPFDAIVTISVDGGPLWNLYSPEGVKQTVGNTHLQPTAAKATVSVSIEGENREILKFWKYSSTDVPYKISGDFPMTSIPMNEAIAGALVPCLFKIWGGNVCIIAMDDSDELISWAGAYAVYSNCSEGSYNREYSSLYTLHVGGWDNVSPDVISALVNAYAHGSNKTSQCAYDALNVMTAGYVYDPLPNLFPILTPEILDSLNTANSSGLNFDSQGNIASITKEAIPSFIQLLGNRNMLIRVAAAQALSKLGSEAIPALSKAVTDNVKDDNAAIAAVYSLKCIGTEAIPALIEATISVRYVAVAALVSMGSKTAPALIHALEDDNPEINAIAADILGSIGPAAKDAVPTLIPSLGNDDPKIIARTADVLGNIGPAAKDAVPALIQALNDKDYSKGNIYVGDALCNALLKITGNQPYSLSDPDIAEYQEWWIAQDLVGQSYLGIYAYDLSYDFGQPSNISATYGIRIPTIRETGRNSIDQWGPSDEILREGDIIIAFNSTTVRNFEEATGYLEKTVPNDLLIITVIRDNSQVDVSVTLGTKPQINQYDSIFL